MLNCDRIYARISLKGEFPGNFPTKLYIHIYIYIHIFTPDLLHINIRKGVEISENVPW